MSPKSQESQLQSQESHLKSNLSQGAMCVCVPVVMKFQVKIACRQEVKMANDIFVYSKHSVW